MNLDTNNLLKLPLLSWQAEAVTKAYTAKKFCNFDTVGVGKTIEALGTTALIRRELGKCKCLIILEGQHITQWANEIKKFVGVTPYIVPEKATKQRRVQAYTKFRSSTDGYLIINYGKSRVDFDELVKTGFDTVIADEASILSNDNKTAEFVAALMRYSKFTMGLTATPMTRNILQMYFLFARIGFKPLDVHTFQEYFCTYEEYPVRTKRGFITKREITGAINLDHFRTIFSDHYVRRRKADLGNDYEETPIHFNYRHFPLSKHQKDYYSKAKEGVLTTYRRNKQEAKPIDKRSSYAYLVQLLNSVKLIDDRSTEESPKIKGIEKFLAELGKEKLIIYSRFVKMGKLIEDKLNSLNVKSVRINKEDFTTEQNETSITKFSKDAQVLIMNDIGSKGFNLQFCSNILFLDFPFNPSPVFQIIGRTDRIGQKASSIDVFFFLMDDSVENNIMLNMVEKQKLFDSVFEEDSAKVFTISDREFVDAL